MTVAALSHVARRSIEGFVRDALGCACPPEVFEDIRLETGPAGFTGVPGARLLAIGGRLLVLLVNGGMTGLPPREISTLLSQGRELRDAGGFNRFRLVIVVPEESTVRISAASDNGSVISGDDRLHLHQIVPAQLPSLLRSDGLQ